MIVPDVNLILYAYDQDGPFHRESADWWSRCLNGSETVGLAPVVIFAFIRLSTSPRIYAEPLSLKECAGIVRSWLEVPVTHCWNMIPATSTLRSICSRRPGPAAI